MTSYSILREKISKKKAVICVIGLGYVGLPLVEAFAESGFFVYGYDTSLVKINKLNKGEKYIVDVSEKSVLNLIKDKKFIPTNDSSVIAFSDVIIICVPTPLRKVKLPDVSFVRQAASVISKNLRTGQLIVLESTSYPMTTRDVVLPQLKKSGLVPEKDFFLCFSPERVNPADKKYPLTRIPKVVGGLSKQSTVLSKNLYSKIIKKIFSVSSPEVAEASKLLENTFRLINIALINEFAILADKLGISIWEVIEAAKTKPFGFMPFYPGPGIGGHCIPTDPLYLSWKAKKIGFKTKMIDLAAQLNRLMPQFVVDRVLKRISKEKEPTVLLIGVTYKKDVKDLREAPAIDIIEIFQKRGIKVKYYDPLIPFLKIGSVDLKSAALSKSSLNQADCTLIVTDHSSLDYKFILKHARFVFDARNVYKGKKADNLEVL
ncbi:MAG: nucleotide sugar dehydrogenase [Candidatus Omnitrophica bacterium]|nr:nucleotide sugar dehydrogenase [Candidatus Omnitrophota bacterium]